MARSTDADDTRAAGLAQFLAAARQRSVQTPEVPPGRFARLRPGRGRPSATPPWDDAPPDAAPVRAGRVRTGPVRRAGRSPGRGRSGSRSAVVAIAATLAAIGAVVWGFNQSPVPRPAGLLDPATSPAAITPTRATPAADPSAAVATAPVIPDSPSAGPAGAPAGSSPPVRVSEVPVVPVPATVPADAGGAASGTSWKSVVQGLFATRAAAFAAGRPDRLDRADAAGSTLLAADRQLFDDVVRKAGFSRAAGLRFDLDDVRLLTLGPRAARLSVTGRQRAYVLTGPAGSTAVAAGDRRELTLELTRATASSRWRLSAGSAVPEP